MSRKNRPKANLVVLDHRNNIVGIDIGKRKHAATAITSNGAVVASLSMFENNKEGIDLLEREVLVPATGRSKPLIALEATGMYWCALHDELSRRGYDCVVLNPMAGDAQSTIVPNEPMYELRLLVRHRCRLIRSQNTILLYAISLLDRVFPRLGP